MEILVPAVLASVFVMTSGYKMQIDPNFSPPADQNDTSTASIKVYANLLNDLLQAYDTRIRPRLHQSFTVEINSTFVLNSIINFDTTGQRIDVMGYFVISWYDEILPWEPQDYEGTNYVMLPLNSVWYPRLVFSKASDKGKQIGNIESDKVKVTYRGLVTWVPEGIYHSMCEVSVEYYPFDVQTCELIYYASDELLTTVLLHGPKNVPLVDYVENSQWRLVEISSTVQERYTTNFVYLILKIERRAEFTIYTTIVPLVTLASINVFTFLIPIESGEKGSLAITLFLAYGFFATLTRDALPHNSIQVSYYIVYITVLLVLSVFTVIYVIIESKIYSCLGSSRFPICWCKSNRVQSIQPQSETKELYTSEKKPQTEKGVTWADVLKWVDMVLFLFTFLVITIFSSVLWNKVMTRTQK